MADLDLEALNREFLELMNAPAGSDLKPPVDSPAFMSVLLHLVDTAHNARLTYIRVREIMLNG